MADDANDEFIAGSDLEEENLPERKVLGELEHRPRLRDEDARPDRPPDDDDDFLAAVDEEDPLDYYNAYENGRLREWEARRPIWAREGYPGPRDYDATVFKNILENETLQKYVKEVQVYTCETHCDHHPKRAFELYGDGWPPPMHSPVYYECIGQLGEIPNLHSVNVHFDRHVGDDGDVFQQGEFQEEFHEDLLPKILHSLNSATNDIAFRNYHSIPREYELPELLDKVAKATSLRLSVAHEETHPGAGSTYRVGNIHPFWETFPARFLQPASSTLKTLVLYSDLPLGWFPKLDLRDVHLPHLASLTLTTSSTRTFR
ncbi:hypothetical protein BU23DRAFT_324829 [Bimuria novae-zelandiae CBS 107.79]|uniref:Uncharacterized protein n=1 Tax=Bimuria novae-zelandiae CBS 107.79 TaxID=1447943 RepID=A0A6A5UP32_9PLEO|nr:hypothetical protein BU23DRAFT_324829 [Bimuria novae-zelandiae CBS 107.79]